MMMFVIRKVYYLGANAGVRGRSGPRALLEPRPPHRTRACTQTQVADQPERAIGWARTFLYEFLDEKIIQHYSGLLTERSEKRKTRFNLRGFRLLKLVVWDFLLDA